MAKIIPFRARGVRPLLREAHATRQLVRLWRDELELGSYCGYIGALDEHFFAMWVLGDNLAFDGIHVMRPRDVTEIELPDQHHVFLEQAISLAALLPGVPPGLRLEDTRALVRSVARLTPVFSVRVDNDNPEESDVCYVGRLAGCEEDGFTLQEVTPDASWLTEPSFFAWDEVSSIFFSDPYALMLARVAGPPPLLADHDSGRGRLQ